jgi:hypothetical protein
VSELAQRILSRFPAHLEADRPGKLLGAVTHALARDLDTLAASVGGVRRSHRLAHADVIRDLVLLGGMNGLQERDLELLELRVATVLDRVVDLEAAVDDTGRQEAAAALFALWDVDWAGLGLPVGDLAGWADPNSPADLALAAERLAAHARRAVRFKARVEAARTRVARVCAQHARGNGTVMALLEGTALALDADILRVQHSEDRFWHAAEIRDRVVLTRGVLVEGAEREVEAALTTDVIGLEENPLQRNETDWTAREHAQLFTILRRGFEDQPMELRVRGIGARTIGPRLTHRDQGHGVGYAGAVPDGEVLVFAADGRVSLEGVDVTDHAYAWRGACFADAANPSENDFVFDDAEAQFAVATPFDALDPDFVFPHAGESLPMPDMAVGVNRLGFYVQVAHASLRLPDNAVRRVPPRPFVGFFDGSIFADADAVEPVVVPSGVPARARADVSFAWSDHEAFAVRVWIPERFESFEPEEGASYTARLARFLGRFKAAGIDLRVAYIRPDWILGEGVLGDVDGDDLIARIRPGTVLTPIPDDGE